MAEIDHEGRTEPAMLMQHTVDSPGPPSARRMARETVVAVAIVAVVAVVAVAMLLTTMLVAPADAASRRPSSCRVVPIAAEHRSLTGPAADVERLYRALFLRRPDRAGLDYWTAMIRRGDADLGEVAAYVASSAEFTKRYGRLSDQEFVDLLYCNVLGRTAGASGASYWRSQLVGGLTRSEAVLHFSQSAEFLRLSTTTPSSPSTSVPDVHSATTTTAAPPPPIGGGDSSDSSDYDHSSGDSNNGDNSDGGHSTEPTLVWADEFDHFDTGVWRREHSTYGDGNGELQCYRPENVAVRSGMLILRAKDETYTCPNGSTREFTSGMVRGRVNFDHGQRIEFRVKVNPLDPDDQRGLWPALWASSWNGGGWPRGGEVDWLEFVGKEPTRTHHTIHYLDTDGRRSKTPKAVELGERFSDSWHVVAFDWTDDLVWYLDGREVQRIAAADVAAIDNPFLESADAITQIKLNVALGGSWGGAIGPTTLDAAGTTNFAIDYVRIYDLG